MPEHNNPQSNPVPHPSEGFGSIPRASEDFGKVPQDSEPFRTVPNNAETFGNDVDLVEKQEEHTLTVREAARMFELAGAARTERSIVNWCQPNKMGVARLDSYFDPNDRKYYLTRESVERAIQEELARATRGNPSSAEPVGTLPNPSEGRAEHGAGSSQEEATRIQDYEKEITDLKITNRAKDYFIDQLKQEREQFAVERGQYVEKLIESNRKVGELETRLLQLESPTSGSRRLDIIPKTDPRRDVVSETSPNPPTE